MAKVIERTEGFEQRVRRALMNGLKTAGIKAQLDVEPLRGTKLSRVTLLSSQFASLRPSERQDLVWRIINQTFSPEEQLRLSTILTLTPDELRGD